VNKARNPTARQEARDAGQGWNIKQNMTSTLSTQASAFGHKDTKDKRHLPVKMAKKKTRQGSATFRKTECMLKQCKGEIVQWFKDEPTG